MNAIARSLVAGLALCAAGHTMANVCQPGDAANDCAPPPGALLDLAGSKAPEYTKFTTTFTATQSTTLLTFALRDNPSFLDLDDIVLQHSGAGANLVENGDFEGGDVAGVPKGWTYANPNDADHGGTVSTSAAHGGASAFRDGATDAYDSITQAIQTIIGQSYELTFFVLDEGDSVGPFVPVDSGATDDGEESADAHDLLVYVSGAIASTSVPEPAGLALLGVGAAALLATRRRIRPA